MPELVSYQPRADEALVFAYGSLMSRRGIERDGIPPFPQGLSSPILSRAWISGVPGSPIRRGFGKMSGLTQGKPRLTMNLSALPQFLSLSPSPGSVSGVLLALTVKMASTLGPIGSREGWPPALRKALGSLVENHPAARSSDVGSRVYSISRTSLSNQVDRSVSAWARVCQGEPYTGIFEGALLPIPVKLTDGRVALVSWAPGVTHLFRFSEIPNSFNDHAIDRTAQREYYDECIAGRENGVDVSDIE